MKKVLLFICCFIWRPALSQSKLYFKNIYIADSLFIEKQYLAAGQAHSLALDNDKSVYNQNDYISAIAAYSLAKA